MMVNWWNTWLEKLDKIKSKIKPNIKKYISIKEYKSITHAFYWLCNSQLKFDQQGFQALYQHFGKPKYENISKLAFGNNWPNLSRQRFICWGHMNF